MRISPIYKLTPTYKYKYEGEGRNILFRPNDTMFSFFFFFYSFFSTLNSKITTTTTTKQDHSIDFSFVFFIDLTTSTTTSMNTSYFTYFFFLSIEKISTKLSAVRIDPSFQKLLKIIIMKESFTLINIVMKKKRERKNDQWGQIIR